MSIISSGSLCNKLGLFIYPHGLTCNSLLNLVGKLINIYHQIIKFVSRYWKYLMQVSINLTVVMSL